MKLKSESIKLTLLGLCLMTVSFSAHSAYVVNGSASASGGDCYILTPNNYSLAGSVWNDAMISLNYNFDMTFQVYLGTNDFGADGIAFLLQPISTGILGGGGGGIGYLGISPSVAVEYDTWQNDDPDYDHMTVQKNGFTGWAGLVAGPVQISSTSVNVEDGLWHSTQIVWDATTKTLTTYFDGVLRLTYTDDLVATIFGGDPMVYWGFTGGTGGASNEQKFCVTSLYFGGPAPVETPVSPWALSIGIMLIAVVTAYRFRRSL